jgi:hypothetical protein
MRSKTCSRANFSTPGNQGFEKVWWHGIHLLALSRVATQLAHGCSYQAPKIGRSSLRQLKE